jgi:sugar O-acyltransferase (sialic acid O-acetyltransferase NeuD family)
MYKNYIKFLLDFIAALIGIVLLSPVFVGITILLFFANQGKPFFIQRRPGKNCKVFRIIKFKTMNDKKDANGNLLSDAERLTAIGNFVRKTSLDEIPQLLNVLKFDMSIIGPRPLLTDYVHLYNEFQNQRHNVKPGITGWAQVNGRNAISWEKKFELDVYYVNNISFWLDMKILFLTIKKVIKSEGISSENVATIEPFSIQPDVYLYGAGGHCKVVLDILLSDNRYNVKLILDDAPLDNIMLGVSVTNNFNKEEFLDKNCIITIGNNQIRKNIANSFKANFIMTIHSNAIISKFAKVGNGTQIMPAAVVNSDAVIGEHCIINSGAIIEHDCILGDYVHISPNATLGGNVTIGELSQVGIGATIIQNITIGRNVMIGAGAVIIKDIPDNAIVVGVPGKVVKYKEV